MSENFEENLKKLEEIVQTLDSGTITLDDALKAFEQGVKLSRGCHKKLQDAEKKVEILLKKEGGNVVKEKFSE